MADSQIQVAWRKRVYAKLKDSVGGGETGGRPSAPARKQEVKLPMSLLSKIGHRPAWAAGLEWLSYARRMLECTSILR